MGKTTVSAYDTDEQDRLSKMAATYTVEYKGDHIEVHSDGEKDLGFAQRLWTDIVAACRDHDCHRVLGIAKTTVPLRVIDGFDHAQMFQDLGVEPSCRIAWVEPDPKSHEVIKFVETVLFNRSIGVFKVFDDEQVAREWLFSERGV